jgi:hypothetical protein
MENFPLSSKEIAEQASDAESEEFPDIATDTL